MWATLRRSEELAEGHGGYAQGTIPLDASPCRIQVHQLNIFHAGLQHGLAECTFEKVTAAAFEEGLFAAPEGVEQALSGGGALILQDLVQFALFFRRKEPVRKL